MPGCWNAPVRVPGVRGVRSGDTVRVTRPRAGCGDCARPVGGKEPDRLWRWGQATTRFGGATRRLPSLSFSSSGDRVSDKVRTAWLWPGPLASSWGRARRWEVPRVGLAFPARNETSFRLAHSCPEVGLGGMSSRLVCDGSRPGMARPTGGGRARLPGPRRQGARGKGRGGSWAGLPPDAVFGASAGQGSSDTDPSAPLEGQVATREDGPAGLEARHGAHVPVLRAGQGGPEA